MKQYSPARTDTKRGNPCRRRRTGVLGIVKTPSPSLLPISGSCSVPVADEVAVGHPLRLNELELPMQMRADQQKDATALSAVILEHAFRQGWSVVCAAAQEMVEIDGDNVVFQG